MACTSRRVGWMVAGLAAACCAPAASADSLIFNLNGSVGGSLPNRSADTPYVRATFTSETPGRVALTLQGMLPGTMTLCDWGFNLAPSLNLANVHITQLNVSGPQATVSMARDAWGGGGAGMFDVRVHFDPNASAALGRRFAANAVATFLITSDQPITATSFNTLSLPTVNGRGYSSVAELLPMSGAAGDGFWVAPLIIAPLPQGAGMGLIGLMGLAGLRRRRV